MTQEKTTINKIEKKGVYALHKPAQNAAPIILDSPHSGDNYPDDFKHACTRADLETIKDAYVDELFADAPHYNATLLCALFPRSYIDVNRARDDIDDLLIDAPWPTGHDPIRPTSRSHAGIGLINRLIRPGKPIYDHKLSPQEIMTRVKNYYDPYHDTLRSTLEDAYYNHGQFWHINCHSMPSKSAYPKRNITFIGGRQHPSDIVLGDRDGSTCDHAFMSAMRNFWKDLGYRVTVNDPFKGVQLIEQYAQPTRGKNSLQIEINRALYMNEKTGKKTEGFEQLKKHCTEMIKFCTAYAEQSKAPIAAD